MERKIKTPEGQIMYLSKTRKLKEGVNDKNDPNAYKEEWVLHNTDGPALIKADGKKEYYFWGIYQGNTPEVIRELKRNHTGLPPAKNPLFKNSFR
jgi:hypothetical protein